MTTNGSSTDTARGTAFTISSTAAATPRSSSLSTTAADRFASLVSTSSSSSGFMGYSADHGLLAAAHHYSSAGQGRQKGRLWHHLTVSEQRLSQRQPLMLPLLQVSSCIQRQLLQRRQQHTIPSRSQLSSLLSDSARVPASRTSDSRLRSTQRLSVSSDPPCESLTTASSSNRVPRTHVAIEEEVSGDGVREESVMTAVNRHADHDLSMRAAVAGK